MAARIGAPSEDGYGTFVVGAVCFLGCFKSVLDLAPVIQGGGVHVSALDHGSFYVLGDWDANAVLGLVLSSWVDRIERPAVWLIYRLCSLQPSLWGQLLQTIDLGQDLASRCCSGC
jgi:hypothetical protein